MKLVLYTAVASQMMRYPCICAFVVSVARRSCNSPTIRAFVVMVMVSLLLLVACAPVSPAQADLAGWHTLYRRAGWQGGSTLDLRAVGDVMLARNVGAAIARNGANYPFEAATLLLDGDLALGNLESPLTTRETSVRPGPYRLLASPELAPALATAGFDALSLANNHGFDAGAAGLDDGLAALRAAGVVPLGAGASETAALAPAVLEASGLRVAVLAFNDLLDPADPPGATLAPAEAAPGTWPNPDFVACGPGSACLAGRAWLSAEALAAVAQARETADAVVVLVHWGIEYAAEPSPRQQAWAARLVAAGADLVLGAHPHVLQPAAVLSAGGRSGFVAYSLGNFVFDGPDDPARNSGAVLRVLLDHNGVALVAVAPIDPVGGRPQPLALSGAEAQSALRSLGAVVAASGPAATTAPPMATTTVASASGAPTSTTATVPRTTSVPARLPSGLSAWRWAGAAADPLAVPADFSVPVRPNRLPVDLRGDGQPLWASLDPSGLVELRDGSAVDAPLRWRNEEPAWRFTRIEAGDPDDDGRVELLLLLWQPDANGVLRSQPYLLGWRGGSYRIIWGGSATATPIQDFAVGDLDQDGRSEFVVLEGGTKPGDRGEAVSVWHWHGWGFQLEWRTAGSWRTLALADLNGDGQQEIVAGQ